MSKPIMELQWILSTVETVEKVVILVDKLRNPDGSLMWDSYGFCSCVADTLTGLEMRLDSLSFSANQLKQKIKLLRLISMGYKQEYREQLERVQAANQGFPFSS